LRSIQTCAPSGLVFTLRVPLPDPLIPALAVRENGAPSSMVTALPFAAICRPRRPQAVSDIFVEIAGCYSPWALRSASETAQEIVCEDSMLEVLVLVRDFMGSEAVITRHPCLDRASESTNPRLSCPTFPWLLGLIVRAIAAAPARAAPPLSSSPEAPPSCRAERASMTLSSFMGSAVSV